MRNARRNETGFSMIELLMTCSLLGIGACGLAAVLVQSMTLSAVNSETSDAQASARQVIERVSRLPAAKIFAACNETKIDDPKDLNDVPGSVITLNRKAGAGTLRARLIFPKGSDPATLREDAVIPELGMPRDLNGDGQIDAENHASDYRILPVLVRVEWDGFKGTRSFEMATAFVHSPVMFKPADGLTFTAGDNDPVLDGLLEELYR